jgi:hypothetical protein
MSEEPPRCQNPACGRVIVVIPGHRRRLYCGNACKMAAHRGRIAAENQARYEALQVQLALREREELRQRWGDLLPETLDLLRRLRITYGIIVADQVAGAITVERERAQMSVAGERATLIDEIMLAGEQVDFPAIATELFALQQGVFAWTAFCGDASIEDLRLAREAAHLKLQARNGRLKFSQHT